MMIIMEVKIEFECLLQTANSLGLGRGKHIGINGKPEKVDTGGITE